MTERTLAIIKPDAVERRLAGRIIQRIEDEGFQIRAMRRVQLSKAEAEGFYAVHRERPFFGSLTEFMSSGPAIVLVLEAPDAIKKWRTLMGATDPAKADAGTLRKEFAESIERNATHGSDAPETAAYEIGYFFAGVRSRRYDGEDTSHPSASASAASACSSCSACRLGVCRATSPSSAATSPSTFRSPRRSS